MTIQTFVRKVMSLLFNMLCRFVIAFHLRSKLQKSLWAVTAAMKLLLGRNVIINLDSILNSRDITLPTKVHLVKAMVFIAVRYGCESWTIKKAER